MAKTVCKILGVVLALAGIAGFLKPDLGGMHLTPIHNVVHLVTAAIALYLGFKGTDSQARTFNQVFGVIYLLLGVLGLAAPDVVNTVIQGHAGDSLTADSVVHLLIGVVCVVVGFMRAPQSAATT
jgi:drug/metabolite transporter (DMT)-like permease